MFQGPWNAVSNLNDGLISYWSVNDKCRTSPNFELPSIYLPKFQYLLKWQKRAKVKTDHGHFLFIFYFCWKSQFLTPNQPKMDPVPYLETFFLGGRGTLNGKMNFNSKFTFSWFPISSWAPQFSKVFVIPPLKLPEWCQIGLSEAWKFRPFCRPSPQFYVLEKHSKFSTGIFAGVIIYFYTFLTKPRQFFRAAIFLFNSAKMNLF